MHAALFLVLAFFTAAALWLLLYAEFLAITLVLVYVGAVMVLFLFVVMMLDISLDIAARGLRSNAPLAALVRLADGRSRWWLLLRRRRDDRRPPRGSARRATRTPRPSGTVLYTDYVSPSSCAAVILLVAIVVAIALTLRTPQGDQVPGSAHAARAIKAATACGS